MCNLLDVFKSGPITFVSISTGVYPLVDQSLGFLPCVPYIEYLTDKCTSSLSMILFS